MIAYQGVEEEKPAEHRKNPKSNSKVAKNGVFIDTIGSLDNSPLERDNTDIKNSEADDWEEKPKENEPTSEAWIRSGENLCTKKKLI